MFKVSVQGINGVKAQFLAATEEIKGVVSAELDGMAKEWKANAQRDAPVDQGSLKAGITYYMDGGFSAVIVSNAFYSPFMEFGTKGKYTPIPGTEAIAEQFRGYKGGDFATMLKMIERWVNRKGIAGTYSVKTRRRTGGKAAIASQNRSAAFAIALSILKNGVSPHPFFFKQQDILWPEMVKNIRRKIEQGQKVKVIMPGEISRPRIVTI